MIAGDCMIKKLLVFVLAFSLIGIIKVKALSIDELPKDAQIHRWGQDFGFNNPSATVEVKIDGDNLYLHEILYETQLTNTQLMEKLKTKYPHLQNIKGFLE